MFLFPVLMTLWDVLLLGFCCNIATPESGLMIFRRISNAPGYEILGAGYTCRNIVELSGLQLVVEKNGYNQKG